MKRLLQWSFILGAVAILTGCLATQNHYPEGSAVAGNREMSQRFSIPQVQTEKVQPAEGAIFSEGSFRNLYSDRRARRVGDILLVKVVETSSGTKKASTKTERSSALTGGVAALFGVEQWLSDRNSRFTPSSTNLQVSLQNDFDGSGETKRDSTVTATLSARVTNVTSNGNLEIRGYREVRVNNETQFMVVTGLVRPADISQDNSILSSHIADARIEYSGTGVISEKQQPGWLARGLDIIWPF